MFKYSKLYPPFHHSLEVITDLTHLVDSLNTLSSILDF